ncbi:MAG TPA: type II toxin-antitoxin system Phd/YefM family antitoxin [Arachnia sp.]|jgi:prevent-host-death family protein|nr:type II toxin-antitoxin system Phd/YefM family antitoxin [Arachnia sp.]
MSVISVSEARRTLPAQIDLVEAGERVEITRHGKVVAVLVSPSAVASPRTAAMREGAEQIRIMLEEARNRPLTQVRLGPERTAELIDDIYANRRAR